MRVLIGCEESGTIRDAFRAAGHDAYSCDLQPSRTNPQWHIQGDLLNVLNEGWELAIFHPPCTHLAVSGARWFREKQQEQRDALHFVRALMQSPIDHWAIENPVSVISTAIRPPDQVIQPWQYGHGETKATCLWLKNLPLLTPTNTVAGRQPRIHMMPPRPNRARERSKTYQGIAEAMAEQWGKHHPAQLTLL